MSSLNTQNIGQEQYSGIVNEDNFENDDLITFQHHSKIINFFYSQLTKYSKHIRESYLFSDVVNRLPKIVQQLQEKYQLLPESIDYFFQISRQNYNINEDSTLTYIQCIDLLKISKFLEVRKLSYTINQYIKSRNIDVDFVIQMIQYDDKTQTQSDNQKIVISKEIEEMLTSKINECISNKRFLELPIQIIYRIFKQSSPNSINCNKLFDFIIKSLNKFCVLFPFLDLQKLSEDRLDKLSEIYSKSNENTRHYFDYLKCNLNFIFEINNRKKNLEEINNQNLNKMKDLESLFQKQLKESEKINAQQQNKLKELESLFQKQLKESDKINAQQQNKMKDLEALFQKQLKESEKTNDQLLIQLNDSKSLNNEQQNKMNNLKTLLQIQSKEVEKVNDQLQNQSNYSKSLENQINQLKQQLKELLMIKGQIVANVEKGLLINAEINLEENSSTLDTTKSKVIISTSDAKYLGIEAYEKGEQITSLHMNVSFACKPGRYYVRCIVFNSNGESNEILSNSVTTSASSLTFDYEGKPAKISLPQGQYKLEVWGAKGGDSTGDGQGNRHNSMIPGGLGGYSRGILKLNKKETVYVFVGDEGRPSSSSEGSSTKGGFPDGGGTRTGHYDKYSTVPGTGGGSTSIRIGCDNNYCRVIVAGGGGGASGDSYHIELGGFGGGLNGGNCYLCGSLEGQGAGTQTGSTQGLGQCNDMHGNPGLFGSGATCNYKKGSDSGGGGGGGWYGGGSGGFGIGCCSSGGGGSGWTFTELSLKTFQSGDSSNASKFELNSTYYLREAIYVGGNENFPRPDGNGSEKGHNGKGYAKITPI